MNALTAKLGIAVDNKKLDAVIEEKMSELWINF
jgi:hypothetical protein